MTQYKRIITRVHSIQGCFSSRVQNIKFMKLQGIIKYKGAALQGCKGIFVWWFYTRVHIQGSKKYKGVLTTRVLYWTKSAIVQWLCQGYGPIYTCKIRCEPLCLDEQLSISFSRGILHPRFPKNKQKKSKKEASNKNLYKRG